MRVITALNAYRAAVWTTISHEGEYQLDCIRTFHDPATGKTWGTRVDGLNAILVSGVSSKTKEIVKPQTDEAAMQRFLEKEEGERLRKGMLLADPHAAPGAPCMLRHLVKHQGMIGQPNGRVGRVPSLWTISGFKNTYAIVLALIPEPENRRFLDAHSRSRVPGKPLCWLLTMDISLTSFMAGNHDSPSHLNMCQTALQIP